MFQLIVPVQQRDIMTDFNLTTYRHTTAYNVLTKNVRLASALQVFAHNATVSTAMSPTTVHAFQVIMTFSLRETQVLTTAYFAASLHAPPV
jgi:hypothetical protein